MGLISHLVKSNTLSTSAVADILILVDDQLQVDTCGFEFSVPVVFDLWIFKNETLFVEPHTFLTLHW